MVHWQFENGPSTISEAKHDILFQVFETMFGSYKGGGRQFETCNLKDTFILWKKKNSFFFPPVPPIAYLPWEKEPKDTKD